MADSDEQRILQRQRHQLPRRRVATGDRTHGRRSATALVRECRGRADMPIADRGRLGAAENQLTIAARRNPEQTHERAAHHIDAAEAGVGCDGCVQRALWGPAATASLSRRRGRFLDLARSARPRSHAVQRSRFHRLPCSTRTLSGLAGSFGYGANLSDDTSAEHVQGLRVTGNFFDVLGARARACAFPSVRATRLRASVLSSE